jgi:hypothetical protein
MSLRKILLVTVQSAQLNIAHCAATFWQDFLLNLTFLP